MALQQQLFKCSLIERGEKETRKFFVDSDVAGNFLYLKEKVRTLFPKLLRRDFELYYTDEEGDKIAFSTNEELQAALLGNMKQVLHIYAVQNSSENNFNGNVHSHVTCDGCEGQVRGFRYKCLQCPDYDLCGKCEAAGMHAGHPMLRVAESLPPFVAAVRTAINDFWSSARVGGNHQSKPFRACGMFQPAGGCPFKQGKRGFCGRGQQGQGCGPQGHPSTSSAFENPFEGLFDEGFLQVLEQSVAELAEHLGLAAFPNGNKDAEETHPTANGNGENVQATPDEKTQDGRLSNASSPATRANEDSVSPTDRQNEAVATEEAAGATSSSPVHDLEDWTVVKETTTNVEPKESNGGAVPKRRPSLEKLEASEPLHPNPAIAASLEKMLAMGFSNDGGWLTQLLEVKSGNIDKVLEVLHPTKH